MTEEIKMKKIIVGILMLLVMLSTVSALTTVTRSISKKEVKPGETITINLDARVDPGNRVIAFIDVMPFENDGKRTVKYVIADSGGAPSEKKSYQMKVPYNTKPGKYKFEGKYTAADSGIEEAQILGDSTITVKGGLNMTYIIATLVILAVIGIIVYIRRKWW